MGVRLAPYLFLALIGCAGDDKHVLYRSSPVDKSMRIHVASFDAADSGPNYNRENCEIASKLFAQQPGVTVKYWCEKGSYKK